MKFQSTAIDRRPNPWESEWWCLVSRKKQQLASRQTREHYNAHTHIHTSQVKRIKRREKKRRNEQKLFVAAAAAALYTKLLPPMMVLLQATNFSLTCTLTQFFLPPTTTPMVSLLYTQFSLLRFHNLFLLSCSLDILWILVGRYGRHDADDDETEERA